MYQQFDNTAAISVNDWIDLGFTHDMLKNDSKRGNLKIIYRSTNGNTLIDVKSIKRPDRLRVIESAFGRLDEKKLSSIYNVEIDPAARDFYIGYRNLDDSPLSPKNIEEYTNRASILNGMRKGLEIQRAARAKAGKKLLMGEFWEDAAKWYLEQIETYPCAPIGYARSIERVFKSYINGGYAAIMHGNTGQDSARKVSAKAERLLIALWRTNGKPFIKEVHGLYLDFVSGTKELHDKDTAEVFNPEEFKHKGRAMEISDATVWNYLKDIVNNTAAYADRNGNFDYVNTKRPKQKRKPGRFSLSKISMDDVAMSRRCKRGWIFKYIAVDVVSGYYFRPPYVLGKPTIDTVIESFQYMFCELIEMGMPMPAELEVEHHLMKDIGWLGDLFPFVRFAKSATDKRAEHAIKSLKWGTAHREGHTRGRWYSPHEAYRCIRKKESGDFVEPEYDERTIIMDDLADIEKHNNELHPLQKTYPGMTRKQVLIQNVNPKLKPIENWYLYRYIGNETETTIINNDCCRVQYMFFDLQDFSSLKNLKPNNYKVNAYWLPEEDGSISRVYLWQDDVYIGEAVNAETTRYNECAIERTEVDEANMLHQNKRNAKFDKFIKDERAEIPRIGIEDSKAAEAFRNIEPEIVENEQPKGYEEDEFTDWAAKAVNSL